MPLNFLHIGEHPIPTIRLSAEKKAALENILESFKTRYGSAWELGEHLESMVEALTLAIREADILAPKDQAILQKMREGNGPALLQVALPVEEKPPYILVKSKDNLAKTPLMADYASLWLMKELGLKPELGKFQWQSNTGVHISEHHNPIDVIGRDREPADLHTDGDGYSFLSRVQEVIKPAIRTRFVVLDNVVNEMSPKDRDILLNTSVTVRSGKNYQATVLKQQGNRYYYNLEHWAVGVDSMNGLADKTRNAILKFYELCQRAPRLEAIDEPGMLLIYDNKRVLHDTGLAKYEVQSGNLSVSERIAALLGRRNKELALMRLTAEEPAAELRFMRRWTAQSIDGNQR